MTALRGDGYTSRMGDPTEPDDAGNRREDAAAESNQEEGPRVSRLQVGGEELIVLSIPLPKLVYPEGTTPTEHEIIDMVLEGLTTKEIAEKRGVSLRTVTTQLGVIFRKANVNSQAELISVMTAANGDS